jgi:hypothetical protein
MKNTATRVAIRARRGRGDVYPGGEERSPDSVCEEGRPSGHHCDHDCDRNGRRTPEVRPAIEAAPGLVVDL